LSDADEKDGGMVVGVCQIELRIPENNSLKGKRQILRKICERTKNKFNISIAEVGAYDRWQRARIGVSLVGNDRRFVNACLDKVINFIDHLQLAEIIGQEFEILSYSENDGF